MTWISIFLNGSGFIAEAADTAKKMGMENVYEGQGFPLTIIGMSVVFSGLVVLWGVVSYLETLVDIGRKFFKSIGGMFKPGDKKTDEAKEEPDKKARKITGEESAAVSMAIILYHRLHMSERRQRITFDSGIKLLSPWAISGKVQSYESPTFRPTKMAATRLTKHGS